MPAARMVEEFRFRSITEQTALYGLAGEGVLTSRVPAMRNAAFAAAGRDAVCVPLPSADAADIQAFADALGLIGWERCT
jgi:shikimate 5-dehydrogenase